MTTTISLLAQKVHASNLASLRLRNAAIDTSAPYVSRRRQDPRYGRDDMIAWYDVADGTLLYERALDANAIGGE